LPTSRFMLLMTPKLGESSSFFPFTAPPHLTNSCADFMSKYPMTPTNNTPSLNPLSNSPLPLQVHPKRRRISSSTMNHHHSRSGLHVNPRPVKCPSLTPGSHLYPLLRYPRLSKRTTAPRWMRSHWCLRINTCRCGVKLTVPMHY
jgi:hypothetical protein